MKIPIIVVVVLILCQNAFSQKDKEMYIDPMFKTIAKSHKTIAVLPFKFHIKLRKKESYEVTEDEIAQMELIDGQLLQKSVYDYLKRKRENDKLKIELQSLKTTIGLLEEQGIYASNIQDYNHKDIAEILGVDAMVFGNFYTEEPFSKAAAATISVLTLGIAPLVIGRVTSSQSNAIFQITNGSNGRVLWRYDLKIGKGWTTDGDALMERVMKKSAKKIPYL